MSLGLGESVFQGHEIQIGGLTDEINDTLVWDVFFHHISNHRVADVEHFLEGVGTFKCRLLVTQTTPLDPVSDPLECVLSHPMMTCWHISSSSTPHVEAKEGHILRDYALLTKSSARTRVNNRNLSSIDFVPHRLAHGLVYLLGQLGQFVDLPQHRVILAIGIKLGTFETQIKISNPVLFEDLFQLLAVVLELLLSEG